jgi:toxin ParE1/3/4
VRFRVVFSHAAKADLAAITHHIAIDSPAAALRLFGLIKDRCNSLDQLPDRGKPMVIDGKTLRHLFVEAYVIRYQVVATQVQIIRIADGRRNLAALWDNET